jgi:hypothetical protein
VVWITEERSVSCIMYFMLGCSAGYSVSVIIAGLHISSIFGIHLRTYIVGGRIRSVEKLR